MLIACFGLILREKTRWLICLMYLGSTLRKYSKVSGQKGPPGYVTTKGEIDIENDEMIKKSKSEFLKRRIN